MISTRLTQRQEQILNFLQQHHAKTGLVPSVREIQQAFGFASSNAIDSHLRALERKQYIKREFGKARAIAIRWGVYDDSPDRKPQIVEEPVEQLDLEAINSVDRRGANGTNGHSKGRVAANFGSLRLDDRTSLVPGDALTVLGLMEPDS